MVKKILKYKVPNDSSFYNYIKKLPASNHVTK